MQAGKTQIAKALCRSRQYDAVVVGSGPNGLACAIAMAEEGNTVLLIEGQKTPGGGCRTLELTIPGFRHDICSAVHPLGLGSPFFRTLPLDKYGLHWINPDGAYVHAFAPGKGLLVEKSLEATAQNIGGASGESFKRLMESTLPDWDELCKAILNPINAIPYAVPTARFGVRALLSARQLARLRLVGEEARAAFSGVAAHACTSLDAPASASIGLVLSLAAHAVGWPIPKGGAQAITDALLQYFLSLGGELVLDCPVRSLAELPACKFLFLDLTPAQFSRIASDRLSDLAKKRLAGYKYGPGCFKMDWALSAPIPWSAPEFFKAPTVHIGGTFNDVAESERLSSAGYFSSRPYVLLAQPTLFDGSRSPQGTHIVWAYCHVPHGSDEDVSVAVENQIERFAPGFRKTILAKSVITPRRFETINENHVGGDINGGALTLAQLFTRPLVRPIPFKTPIPNVYLCSSSTPPGSGVHGMCGYFAARIATATGAARQMAIPAS